MANTEPSLAVQRCHDLLLWLIPLLDQFPRNRRFTLGERLETGLLDVLGLLIEAAYSRNKQASLRQANLTLAKVRHLWRLAFELKLIVTTQRNSAIQLKSQSKFRQFFLKYKCHCLSCTQPLFATS